MGRDTLTKDQLFETTSDSRRFVERRYPDGEIDWLWVRFTRPTDIDCTDLSDDELADRIHAARGLS
jgi:hypothetical protein